MKTNQALGDFTIELNNCIAQNEKGCPYRKYRTVLPILSSAGMFCFLVSNILYFTAGTHKGGAGCYL